MYKIYKFRRLGLFLSIAVLVICCSSSSSILGQTDKPNTTCVQRLYHTCFKAKLPETLCRHLLHS